MTAWHAGTCFVVNTLINAELSCMKASRSHICLMLRQAAITRGMHPKLLSLMTVYHCTPAALLKKGVEYARQMPEIWVKVCYQYISKVVSFIHFLWEHQQIKHILTYTAHTASILCLKKTSVESFKKYHEPLESLLPTDPKWASCRLKAACWTGPFASGGKPRQTWHDSKAFVSECKSHICLLFGCCL